MSTFHTPSWLEAFWAWYERHYKLNLTITAVLFSIQVVHLYWLATDVLAMRALGVSYFSPTPFWQSVLILVDYTEIPALLSTTVLYLREFRQGRYAKSVPFLLMINSQWLHLFWITDEFVVSSFRDAAGTVLPAWLAWVAIIIDYLEVPVIIDTLWQVGKMAAAGPFWQRLKASARYHLWHV
jgi:hypothetical protein